MVDEITLLDNISDLGSSIPTVTTEDFSVQEEVTNPPSLKNIFKEIESDIGAQMSGAGDLSKWAEQGVLLLNATLTVLASNAGSHQRKGWEEFTDAVIKTISDKKDNVVFLLCILVFVFLLVITLISVACLHSLFTIGPFIRTNKSCQFSSVL